MRFTQELVSKLWESGARYSKIMFIPALAASQDHRVSDDFQEFLEDIAEDYQRTYLFQQCPKLKNILNVLDGEDCDSLSDWSNDIAHDLYHLSGEFEFLVQLEIYVPRGFRFNDKGEFVSCNVGGAYRQLWVMAKNMVDAAGIAISEAEKIFQTERDKALREQGFAHE